MWLGHAAAGRELCRVPSGARLSASSEKARPLILARRLLRLILERGLTRLALPLPETPPSLTQGGVVHLSRSGGGLGRKPDVAPVVPSVPAASRAPVGCDSSRPAAPAESALISRVPALRCDLALWSTDLGSSHPPTQHRRGTLAAGGRWAECRPPRRASARRSRCSRRSRRAAGGAGADAGVKREVLASPRLSPAPPPARRDGP